MRAEIISVGTELTTGQNTDTNSPWLSRRLSELGIPVGWHTTVGDNEVDHLGALRAAVCRAGLVIMTGGLGPTQDDLTREVLARLADVPLVLDEPSLTHIRDLFSRRHREMPERNRVQAMIPEGAEAIPNPGGTAPGVWMRLASVHVAALPGVPAEMRQMFDDQVAPRLQALGVTGDVLVERKINCFGTGEAAVEEKLLDLTARGADPEVGITVSDATVSLRILTRGRTRAEALARAEPVERTVRARLGSLVFGVDDEELQDIVVRLLRARDQTLSVAESVTCGMVAEHLGRVPGVSVCLRGGIIAYQDAAKVALLGVSPDLLAAEGAVSAAVAEAMAAGCRARFGTDYAISTTGVAGPGDLAVDRPAGLIYVGLSWAGGVSSRKYSWSGTREGIRRRTAKLALNELRLHLARS